MLRASSLLASLAVIIGGCVTPIMTPMVDPPVLPMAPTWSITIPSTWISTRDDRVLASDRSRTVYEAYSPRPIGDIPIRVKIAAVVFTGEDGGPEMFARASAEVLANIKGSQLVFDDVLDTEHGPMGFVVFITASGGLVVQASIAANEIGYVVSCYGDADSHEEVARTCKDIVTSFTPR